MPVAVLLAGLTGSGKTTVAQALAAHGYIRLSVDEEVHRLHGRYGVGYPEHTYFERERPVVAAIRKRFTKEIAAGNDVVLDHGLWRRDEREAWRQAAREAGGLPLVVYLPVDREELLRRLALRNEREDANALTVPPKPSTTSSPASTSQPRTRKPSSTAGMSTGWWPRCPLPVGADAGTAPQPHPGPAQAAVRAAGSRQRTQRLRRPGPRHDVRRRGRGRPRDAVQTDPPPAQVEVMSSVMPPRTGKSRSTDPVGEVVTDALLAHLAVRPSKKWLFTMKEGEPLNYRRWKTEWN